MTRYKPGLGIAALLLISCGTFDDSLSEFEPTPQEIDEIQRREMIRVLVSGAQQEVVADSASGLAGTVFTSRCLPHYTATVQTSPAFVNPASPGGCAFADLVSTTSATSCDVVMCRAHTSLCIAHTLLDIVNSPTASVFGTTTVPPQPATARAELTRVAAKYSQLALLHSGGALQQEARDLGGVCASLANDTILGDPISSTVPAADVSGSTPGAPASSGTSPNPYPRSRGEILASTFVDAYELVRESAAEVSEEMLAVADAQTAERSDESRAALFTQTGALVSRGALSATLVGYAGRAGLFTFPGLSVASAPICQTEAGTDPGVSAATDILHAAAIRPDVLRGGASLDNFLVGSLPEGNVRDRIFETTGFTPPIPVTTPDEFLRSVSVTRADMLRARSILSQEHVAFGRSDRIDAANRVDSQTGPGGVPLAYPRYASTSRPPSQVPAAVWPVNAREIEPLAWNLYQAASQDRTASPTVDSLFAPNATVYATRNTANLLDWAYSVAYDAVSVSTTSVNGLPGWPATWPTNSVDPTRILRAHLISASYDHRGRGEVCYRRKDASTEQYQVRLYTDVPAAAIRVVRGTDGLRCATTGYVDGVRCSMSTYEAAAPTACTPAPTTATGFSQCLQWGSTAGLNNIGNTTWYFVTPVGDRGSIGTGQPCTFGYQCLSGTCAAGLCSGAVPPPAGTNNPGSFRALGGVGLPTYAGTTYLTTLDWQFCRETPFVASVDEMVREAMERDPDDCTEAATSCSGLNVNHLLPLENELISDSDQYEDSWRHYLDLAARESAHADELADAIINNGIYIDERQERAADELERLCGASLTLNGIFDPTLSTFIATTPPTCTLDSQCTAEYRCFAGRCQRDPVRAVQNAALSDAERARLNECLGDASVIPAVNLGTTPVCYWRRKTNPTAVCDADSTGTWDDSAMCPYPAARNASDVWVCPTVEGMPTAGPTDFQLVLTEPLGLFDPDSAATTGLAPPDCQDIRDLREGLLATREEREAAANRLRESGFFTPANIRALARRVGWEARPGDYSSLTIDGRNWISTGDATSGGASSWPCAPSGADCAAGNSLWCMQVDCNASAAGAALRATANERLYDSVVWLQSSAAAGSRNRVVPYFLRPPTSLFYLDGFNASSVSVTNLSALPFGPGVQLKRFGIEHLQISSPDGIYGDAVREYDVAPFVSAHCVAAGSATLWTRVEGGALIPETAACAPSILYDFPESFVRYRVPSQPDSDYQVEFSEAWWSGIGTPAFDATVARVARPSLAGHLEELVDAGTVNESAASNFRRGVTSDAELQIMAVTRGTVGDELDAMELACEVAHSAEGACDLSTPPSVSSIADLEDVRGYLNCAANAIAARNASMVLPNMPRSVATVVQEAAARNARTDGGGEFGVESSEIASQLLLFRASSLALATELRRLEADLGRLESAVQLTELRRRRSEAEFVGQLTSGIVGCASALGTGNFNAGLSGCASSIASVSLARTLNELERDELAISTESSFDDFVASFGDRSDAVREIAISLDSSYHRVNGVLLQVDTSRRQARGALARAVGADSDAMGRQYALTTALRRRHSTNVVRYQEALLNARRLAYLARRSIEQRFGIDLRELDRDMGLVEPPREWIDRVCTMTGIDYDRIRSGTTPMTTYADGYIGDYVRRLELLVEGYRLAYPFHDADDTTVLSMRDEILNVRDQCEVVAPGAVGSPTLPTCPASSRNILPYGENLSAYGAGAWQLASCTALSGGLVENCIAVGDLPAGTRGPNVAPIVPFTDGGEPDGTVGPVGTTADEARAFELRFGGPAGVAGTSLAANSRLSQTLTLPIGRYRVSWYGRSPDASLPPNEVLYLNGAQVPSSAVGVWAVTSATAGWSRYWHVFDVTASSGATATVHIGVGHGTAVAVKRVQLSSWMLENVDATTPLNGALGGAPGAFMPSGYGAGLVLPYAEDTDGDQFRQRWRRDCVRLCPSGFSSCDVSATEPYCFWETEFSISEESIEQGRIIRPGGFALGNFNYRFNSIALNFVGSAARVCEDDTRPSTCYSSAYIPYSLYHDGPFTVRNHVGGSYYAPITPGRLEHGRGLAAERYVSNPISSADAALLGQYTHTEWRGRPLTGRYTVRVWDVEGVNFRGIEDVQVVLGYHYWTRAE